MPTAHSFHWGLSAIKKRRNSVGSSCDESAQASCLQLTQSLKEGSKVMCYPQTQLCERAHASAEARDDVSELSDCAVYR